MHRVMLSFVLVIATLVIGAWTSASAVVGPTCSAEEKRQAALARRDGYYLGCGPGSAVVRATGRVYRMRHSKCFIGAGGARLYFGLHRFDDPQLAPQNSLYLVVEPYRLGRGSASVGDGGLELVTGTHAAILGTAQVEAGLKRGTFTLFEHVGDGVTNRRRFVGSWNCSGPVK